MALRPITVDRHSSYMLTMSSVRHYAAPQYEGRGPKVMAIGEFGGAPASGGPVLSNGLYWLYEAGHAALQPARAFADVTRLYFKNPLNPFAHTTYGKSLAADCRVVRALDAPLRQARLAHRFRDGRRRARADPRHAGLGAAVLPAAAFRAHVLPHAAAAAAQDADRRADVGPLRHAAARHGRGVPDQPRRLHHRLDRRAHGAGRRRAASISTTTSTTSSASCISSAATPMSSRCASRRFRCSPRPR